MNEQNNLSKPKVDGWLKDLKWYEILAICWPIFLMFIGGAIGGASGGLACAFNQKIFRSNLSGPFKYVYSFLVGIGAILLYLLVIVVLSMIFPNLFKKG